MTRNAELGLIKANKGRTWFMGLFPDSKTTLATNRDNYINEIKLFKISYYLWTFTTLNKILQQLIYNVL